MHFSADSHSTPHFSLLVTTRNRRGPFIRLLESLVVQKYPHFTVLLGDQNPPQFLADILQNYSTKLDIDYRLITPKGLSAARNQLLPHVKGDIVALTDDDCHYSPDTLLKVANFFSTSHHISGCIGSFTQKLPAPSPVRETRFSVFRKAPSWLIFLRRTVVEQVGEFDESLGTGASTPYQSGEETDYLLRALSMGFNIYRRKDIVVFHDPWQDGPESDKKLWGYSQGRMELLRKHNFSLTFKLLNVLYPLTRMVLSSDLSREYYWKVFRGRLYGLMQRNDHRG
ncbi:glycosyltransferase family 2 protein [Desulfovibrio desulfuricans]|uniref:glycosyltransferase family 2 protein n=1 Tax=Desulfovibrio desulfuricans TaxID=876 RepID=UPI001F31AED9|nr:glycosyltransferase family A protein [Desulfovibrio desulfuricans]UIA99187.1 glycosyltransferase family 2 protein [Desulfovibrio desulfuricans]